MSTRKLPEQALHTRDQGRWLDIQRPRQLAQGSECRLADTALDLTDERAVDVGAQRQCFLGNASGRALVAQHTTKRSRHLIRSPCAAIIRPTEAFGPRHIVNNSISLRFHHESIWSAMAYRF